MIMSGLSEFMLHEEELRNYVLRAGLSDFTAGFVTTNSTFWFCHHHLILSTRVNDGKHCVQRTGSIATGSHVQQGL